MVPTLALDDQVAKIASRLADEYAESVPDPVVRKLVREAYGHMATARVTQFVPVLVDREVRQRLRGISLPD